MSRTRAPAGIHGRAMRARQFCKMRSMKRMRNLKPAGESRGLRVMTPQARKLACGLVVTLDFRLSAGFFRSFRHTEHAEEEAAEDGLHAQHHEREAPEGVAQGRLHFQRAPVLATPLEQEPDVKP